MSAISTWKFHVTDNEDVVYPDEAADNWRDVIGRGWRETVPHQATCLSPLEILQVDSFFLSDWETALTSYFKLKWHLLDAWMHWSNLLTRFKTSRSKNEDNSTNTCLVITELLSITIVTIHIIADNMIVFFEPSEPFSQVHDFSQNSWDSHGWMKLTDWREYRECFRRKISLKRNVWTTRNERRSFINEYTLNAQRTFEKLVSKIVLGGLNYWSFQRILRSSIRSCSRKFTLWADQSMLIRKSFSN